MKFHRSTQFVDLSNDLFLEIFDYLDIVDLFRSFANLNRRFRSLIIDRRLNFQANFLHLNDIERSFAEEILLPEFAHFLRHLKISSKFSFLKNFSFERLESICFVDVDLHRILSILHSSQCKSISIRTKRIQNEKILDELFQKIFFEQKKLRSIDFQFFTSLHFVDMTKNPSQLRRVIIRYPCVSNDLIVLISQLKVLKVFIAQIDDSKREIIDRDVEHLKPNSSIRWAKFSLFDISVERFEYFLQFFPKLQSLNLICSSKFSLKKTTSFHHFHCEIRDDLSF